MSVAVCVAGRRETNDSPAAVISGSACSPVAGCSYSCTSSQPPKIKFMNVHLLLNVVFMRALRTLFKDLIKDLKGFLKYASDFVKCNYTLKSFKSAFLRQSTQHKKVTVSFVAFRPFLDLSVFSRFFKSEKNSRKHVPFP